MRRLFILLVLSSISAGSGSAQSLKVPFTPDRWYFANAGKQPGSDVQFFTHEGFPEGAVQLKAGTINLKDLVFRDGTIEFDMKTLAQDIPGIRFRIHGPAGQQDGEEFYVRTFPECLASNDCIQYAPLIHGFMLWNSYPQYQTRAFILDGWNHIKLVVSGRRMNVYINYDRTPALIVGNLESDSVEGGLSLSGPAVFANLVVTPNAPRGLLRQPSPDPKLSDPGMVRHWLLGPATAASSGESPAYSNMPGLQADWQPIAAGRFGLVNLNRPYVLDLSKPPPVMWLRTCVTSIRDGKRHVNLGWLGAAWIFVNGKLIAQGRNFYYPESERRQPDGRLDLHNGSFDIPLQKGNNEIVVALFVSIHGDSPAPNRYGAGLEMRFEDASGLVQARTSEPPTGR